MVRSDIEMNNKKYHTVGTVPNLSRAIVENDEIDTANTQEHYLSLPVVGTCTWISRFFWTLRCSTPIK